MSPFYRPAHYRAYLPNIKTSANTLLWIQPQKEKEIETGLRGNDIVETNYDAGGVSAWNVFQKTFAVSH